MVFSAMLSFIGCSDFKKNSEIAFLQYRVSGYNPGYYIQLENGKIIYENYDEHKKKMKWAKPQRVSELMGIFKKYDIYSWDGYDKSDDEVLDGMGFSLYVQFSDGSCINAHGNNMFPQKFREFDEAICSLVN